MKNTITDLRNHLFSQLERLGDEQVSKEEMAIEIEKSKAMKEIAQVIVNSAKVEVDFLRKTGRDTPDTDFFDMKPLTASSTKKRIA